MADLRATIESVFRQESGIIIAGLIRVSGSFDLAEEAMQEAFATALVHWPKSGVPQNPAAWITTTAKRINNRVNKVGIERPKVRHPHSVKHLKTSILID